MARVLEGNEDQSRVILRLRVPVIGFLVEFDLLLVSEGARDLEGIEGQSQTSCASLTVMSF